MADWDDLLHRYPFLRPLHDCPQSPEFHGEGDVGIHTRMVVQALEDDPAWQALPAADREVLWWAALLHDVAKPECTRQEGDRFVSPGHARRGSVRARQILWEQGMDPRRREQVCALVKHHMVPGWLLERDDPRRLLAELSQTARCDWLTMLSRADMRGRIARDQADLLVRVALFEECAREHDCWDRPFPFPSSTARFEYFRATDRDPAYSPHEDFRCRVTVLSGLPGAGKDTWIAEHTRDPVISLDGLRDELGLGPRGQVADLARERARAYLRERTDFVWNATNLSRDVRSRCLDLFANYGAQIHLVYREAPLAELEERNYVREFPQEAVDGLLRRWEVPEPWEAHQVSLSFSD